MISFLKQRCSPIGVDVGQRSVKLLQMDGDRTTVVQTARWDLVAPEQDAGGPPSAQSVTSAIKRALQSRKFYGSEAVLCLGGRQLFVQNIRVPKTATTDLETVVKQEAAGKVPFSITETEVRYLEAADIRQGDTTRREVILLACHRPQLEGYLDCVVAAGLRPVAVDVEPAALVRCYAHQYRRDQDRQQRVMYVHVGATSTVVVIAQGANALFVKYLDLGGSHMNDAVARGLGMEPSAATMMRMHNGDRRKDQQDPEVAAGVEQALRPVLDQLANELLLCIRYHSVTFRGQRLARVVIGGGEASDMLVEQLNGRLDLTCELGDPFRTCKLKTEVRRRTQWDIAAGLALRGTE